MPRLLLNATTLHIGGALQVAANFILHALEDTAIDWRFAVSQRVFEELEPFGIEPDQLSKFHIFWESPARNLALRTALKDLERSLNPDAVFSLFGPAYVKFESPHLMGFANPWLTHPNKYAFATVGGRLARLKSRIETAYRTYWLSKAHHWVVESEIAKRGVSKLTGQSAGTISVVANGCRDEFKSVRTKAPQLATANPVEILYISAYYPHKNFKIIPQVAKLLKDKLPSREIRFTLTLDPADAVVKPIMAEAERLGVADRIDFVGRVAVAAAARLYEHSHVAFIPTLLESFSATYSEALTCGLPIVTTDLPFATDILGDCATYCQPNSVEDSVDKIIQVITDTERTAQQIERGWRLAATLPDGAAKYSLYREILAQFCVIPPQVALETLQESRLAS